MQPGKTFRRLTRLLRALVYILVFIALASVARRILAMNNLIPNFSPGGGPPFDAGFAKHPVIMYIHMLPGVLFMILGPLQFMPAIREKHIRFHRLNGRVYLVSACLVGLSALSLPFIVRPIGGVNEAAATTLFALVFLASLSKAFYHILRREIALHREWMIRAFSIGLAIGTIRPIIGLFFALSGQPPQVFFGTAFWIGFTLHLILAEVWINYTRPQVIITK